MVRIRIEVLETIGKWITCGGGAQDVLDDAQLYANLLAFLSQPVEFPAHLDESQIPHGLAVLEDTRKTLLASFVAQQKRPLSKVHSHSNTSTRQTTARNFGSDIPEIDEMDPETLVGNLDAMASAAFRNVVQEVRTGSVISLFLVS